MNLKGRIERLETRRANQEDTVTLGDIVAYSYRDDDDRDLALEERISRSWIAHLIAESVDRGRRAEALAAGRDGETSQTRLH